MKLLRWRNRRLSVRTSHSRALRKQSSRKDYMHVNSALKLSKGGLTLPGIMIMCAYFYHFELTTAVRMGRVWLLMLATSMIILVGLWISICPVAIGSLISLHLNRHMLTHQGHKPFSCSLCNGMFARSEDLKVHLRSHSGVLIMNIISSLILFLLLIIVSGSSATKMWQ